MVWGKSHIGISDKKSIVQLMEPIEDMYKQTRRMPLDICLLFKKTSISDISNIDNNVFASLQSGHKVWWISIKWVNYVSFSILLLNLWPRLCTVTNIILEVGSQTSDVSQCLIHLESMSAMLDQGHMSYNCRN